MSNPTATAPLRWLDLPKVIDNPELRNRYREQLIQEIEDHAFGPLAHHMRVTESDLVEWRTEGLYIYTLAGDRYFDCL